MKISFLDNEYWYGGYVVDGSSMPLDAASEKTIDLTINYSVNQAAPFFLSSKGRYIWRNEGFKIRFCKGEISCPDDVILEEGYHTLRGAYLAAMKKHFPFEGKMPARALFEKPIYNSWIELTFYQSQAAIETYTQDILKNGLPAGVLMIDDGWSNSYGDWTFHTGKFPQPREMIAHLHELDFKVMLWICPFVTADTVAYRDAVSQDILVKNASQEPLLVHWWNGYSAVLDMTNPKAQQWLAKQLADLQELGIDGFKFDAGDSFFYPEFSITFSQASPDEQSQAWSQFGEAYSFNEFRATVAAGGRPLLQRLCDKHHTWEGNGIASLIPDTLAQGITGHPFACPDMIGGGEYLNFQEASEHLDAELFIRYAEIACLMPAMQFSAAPYRVLDSQDYKAVQKTVATRECYQSLILDLVEKAAVTGEPVIRYMAYEFPDEAVEMITDQFMLGSQYLVAPIVKPRQTARSVYLPKGTWILNGKSFDSTGEYKNFEAEYGQPLVFERVLTLEQS